MMKSNTYKAAVKATRLREQSKILDYQADDLIRGTAIKIAPVTIGSVLMQRDRCNRVRYFRVAHINGSLRGQSIVWYAMAFRCTRVGLKRGGTVRFNAESTFTIVSRAPFTDD